MGEKKGKKGKRVRATEKNLDEGKESVLGRVAARDARRNYFPVEKLTKGHSIEDTICSGSVS